MLLPPNDPIYNPGYKYVQGLNTEFKAAKLLAINPGSCRDSSNVNDMVVQFSLIVDGSLLGAGGLDTGVLAPSKLYRVFLIGDSKKYNAQAGLLSLADEPLLPQGYDMYRRVGYVPTNTNVSPNVQFQEWYQYGASENKTYYFANAITVGSALNVALYTDLEIDVGIGSDAGRMAVPVTASQAIVQGDFAATENMYFLPYDPDLTVSPLTGSVFFKNGSAGPCSYTFSLPVGVKPDANPLLPSHAAIKYRGGLTKLSVCGFVDELY